MTSFTPGATGIGTAPPNGGVPQPPFSAPPAAPKIVRGKIDTAGPSILAGSGFSVVRNGAGDVTITFLVPFATPPVVVCSTEDGSAQSVAENRGTPTTTTARLLCFVSSTGAGADKWVNFIAFEPV